MQTQIFITHLPPPILSLSKDGRGVFANDMTAAASPGLARERALRDPAAMMDGLLEMLPLPQRLALAYAPGPARPATLALFALDTRLGQALRQTSEPIMAQMRLAWWRDQLRLPPSGRERADELVRALDALSGEAEGLLALVDGWELLLSEEFGTQVASAFATARAQALLALARVVGARDRGEDVLFAGQRWALADLASGLGDPEERSVVLEMAGALEGKGARLSRRLRPLGVLDGLARRSLARGGRPLLDGPGSALAAIRLGLSGW